jgi:DNA-binding response OmpR family regulator
MSRILVVEDDHDLLFLYSTALSREGFEVVTSNNAGQAILILTNELFDLIVLDVNMPGTPGTKVAEFTRSDVRLKHIPILIVSANDRWKDQALKLGVRRFLIKPVPMQELIQVVNHLLNS